MRLRFSFALIFVWLLAGVASAQTTNYKAHAIFLFSIAKYSQWPGGASGGQFVIVVLGKTRLYDELLATSANHSINGMKVSVMQANEIAEIKQPQMILLADNKSNALAELMKATASQPIMIITEREGLHKKGAGVSFFVNDAGKLNFDLNLTEMNKRTITLSKSLTALAASTL